MSASKIRIFIGTEQKTVLQQKVLKYSIRKHTRSQIEFISLIGESWEKIQDRPLGIGTGFSLLRWTIPEKCNFEGYAIYLDVDMLVLTDIKHLWEADVAYPNRNTSVWCTNQNGFWETSCMFIDCEKAKLQWLSFPEILKRLQKDTDRKQYKELMRGGVFVENPPQQIPNTWNHLNTYEKDKTNILHYTIEWQQPWYDDTHPLRYVWEEYFKECLSGGVITKEEVLDETKKFKKEKGSRVIGMSPYWKKYC